eukprot:763306-Hanusia_phi.AAC.1
MTCACSLNDDDEELNDFLKDPSNKRMINEPDAVIIEISMLHLTGHRLGGRPCIGLAVKASRTLYRLYWRMAQIRTKYWNRGNPLFVEIKVDRELTMTVGRPHMMRLAAETLKRGQILKRRRHQAQGPYTMLCSTAAPRQCSGCVRRDAMWIHRMWLDGLRCILPFGGYCLLSVATLKCRSLQTRQGARGPPALGFRRSSEHARQVWSHTRGPGEDYERQDQEGDSSSG